VSRIRQPILRAISESGETLEDPSEDALFELLSEVDSGTAEFLIVERTSDPNGQTYVQTVRLGGGHYLVERRDGAPDRHFKTVALNMRDAHALLTGWAFGLTGWDRGHAWSRLE
jgi:hypothetical protein